MFSPLPSGTRSTPPFAPTRAPLWRRIIAGLAIRRSRTRLSKLDDHLLRDIGLSRPEAEAEAERPVWDIPEHWKR